MIEFDFSGRGGRRVWLVLERREASVCLKPPGFPVQLVLRAELALFYRVWLGDVDYAAARSRGAIVVDGPPALSRQLPTWFMWSPMTHWVRAARSTRPRTVGGAGLALRPPRSGSAA